MGKIPILINVFQRGWNHQPGIEYLFWNPSEIWCWNQPIAKYCPEKNHPQESLYICTYWFIEGYIYRWNILLITLSNIRYIYIYIYMFYLVMLNSWQNSAKRVTPFHFPAGLWVTMLRRRRTGISTSIGSLEWSKNAAVILQMEAEFGTVHCLNMLEIQWNNFFPRGADICRNLRAYHQVDTMRIFASFVRLGWLDASLTHTVLVAPKGTVLGADRHFGQFVALSVGGSWNGRCRVRFPIKQHMVPGCPRRLVSMVCKLLRNYF